MKIFQGNSISKGLAFGRIYIMETKTLQIPNHDIDAADVSTELARYTDTKAQIHAELDEFLSRDDLHDNEREILATHLEILLDPELDSQITLDIEQNLTNAANAIWSAYSKAIDFFQGMQNDMFAQRAIDYRDVVHRLLENLIGEEADTLEELRFDHIPLITEPSPSLVSKLHQLNISAFICEDCSYNSHAAILSRALGMAVVSGISEFRSQIQADDMLIVDGEDGRLVIDPDEEQLEFFAQKVQILELVRQKQAKLKATACKTKDDEIINLAVNIEIPEELPGILELDCDGIGLFRTEFIYLASNKLPDEETQYQIYKDIVSALAPKPVTIRTFDLGGDKLPQIAPTVHEHNPYLGNRGIRLSLAHPEILRTQLRAIIRASAHGKVKIMFPMVIDVDDFIEARNIYNGCVNELYTEGYEYDSSIALGCMIEIPSAALTSDTLARECDFLSIGTNDLVQYTLAVDRNNEAVCRYYIQHHPAVLKLIRATISNAAKHEKPVSVCGEMASLPEYIPLLIGMGITELSVNPATYYETKSIIQNCDQKLRMIVKNFDFSTSLPKVDELVYTTLKHYYKTDGSYL